MKNILIVVAFLFVCFLLIIGVKDWLAVRRGQSVKKQKAAMLAAATGVLAQTARGSIYYSKERLANAQKTSNYTTGPKGCRNASLQRATPWITTLALKNTWPRTVSRD